MAKWGEGDPRWIVEERADATNVNNWHWTERDATNWSKEKLTSLLIGLTIEGPAGIVKLKEFATLNGEASANNRKNKLIFFYEWDISLKWKGTLNNDDKDAVSGTISIPNLSDEQDLDEIEIDAKITDPAEGCAPIKEMLSKKGKEVIREKLGKYICQLRTEFTQGMILPTANQSSNEQQTTKPAVVGNLQNSKNNSSSNLNQLPSVGVKIDAKKISMTETFMCSKEELYRALTEQNLVQAFTREPITEYSLQIGGRFSLFSGLISGEFQQLVPNATIVQYWRMRHWPAGHHSTVTIQLSQDSNCTVLTLTQTGVPASEAERTETGWRNYYWNSIRQTFGFATDIAF